VSKKPIGAKTNASLPGGVPASNASNQQNACADIEPTKIGSQSLADRCHSQRLNQNVGAKTARMIKKFSMIASDFDSLAAMMPGDD